MTDSDWEHLWDNTVLGNWPKLDNTTLEEQASYRRVMGKYTWQLCQQILRGLRDTLKFAPMPCDIGKALRAHEATKNTEPKRESPLQSHADFLRQMIIAGGGAADIEGMVAYEVEAYYCQRMAGKAAVTYGGDSPGVTYWNWLHDQHMKGAADHIVDANKKVSP